MDDRDGLLAMWNEACRCGMAHTAHGILCDLFSLWDELDADPDAPAHHPGFKEDLMQILGDADGWTLPDWRRLWLSDRDGFDRRAARRIAEAIDA